MKIILRLCRHSWLALLLLTVSFLGVAATPPPPFAVSYQGMKSLKPTGIGWAGQVAVGGKIYVFGGILVPEDPHLLVATNATEIYDPATDTWTTGAPMPTGRWLSTAIAVSGKIYVMGGKIPNATGTSDPVNVNEIYDIATDTWTTGTAMPLPIRGHMADAYNGKIYVFGGNTGTYQTTLNIYNPATNSWSSGAALPAKRAYGMAFWVASKSRFYIVGGDNGASNGTKYYGNAITYDPVGNAWDSATITMVTGSYESEFGGCLTDGGLIVIFAGVMWDTINNADLLNNYVTQILDTSTNTFSLAESLSPSTLTRTEASASFVNGECYLIGGTASPRLVDVFDPSTQLWFEGNAPLPDLEENGNMAAIGGKLYFVNGANGAGLNGSVYVYDPTSGAWSTGPTNPKPRYGQAADVYDGTIVMADGADDSSILGDAQSFDPSTGTFTSLATDPTPTNVPFGAVVGDKFYVFGGYDSGTQADLASGRALDLTNNTWSAVGAVLPSGIEAAAAAAVGGKIYMFGGYDGSTDDELNDVVLIYDPEGDSITSGATMPIPVNSPSATAYGQYVIVYGGVQFYSDGINIFYRETPFAQVYDTEADTFYLIYTPYHRETHAAALIGDNLYVTGGSDHTYAEDRLDIISFAGTGTLKATAGANKTSGAPPLSVGFTGNASGGTAPYTYSWNFGDGSAHSSQQNPTHNYTLEGTFHVTLTVTDSDSATASDTHLTITVSATSAFRVTTSASTTSGPAPLTVGFNAVTSNGTGPFTFDWNFGDGTSHSSAQDPTHVFASADRFRVTCTATDSTGAVSMDNHLLIIVTGSSSFSVTAAGTPTSGNAPLTVNFTGTPSGGASPYTYDWNFGDGSAHSTAQSPSHTFTAAGTFHVALTAKDATSATAGDSHLTITAAAGFTVAATANPSSGSAPLAVAFTATTSGGIAPFTYDWNFGDGSSHSTDQNPSHTFAAAGTFTVTLTAKDATNATESDSHLAIHVSAPLSISATASPASGTAPLTTAFTGSAAGGTAPYSYDWDFGDGAAHSTQQNPSHVFSTAGVFHVTLTAKDSLNVKGSDSHLSITVAPPLAAAATASTASGSAPMAVTFAGVTSGGTAPITYDWDFGDGTTHSAEQSPSHTFTAAGTFHVTFTAKDAASATALDNHVVISVSAPVSVVAVANPSTGASPLLASFVGMASGGTAPYTYDWDFGDGSAHSTSQSPSHTYSNPGAFHVALTAKDASGGSASDEHLTIAVTAPLAITATASPTSGTAPLSVSFSATATGGSAPYAFAWTFGDGTTGSGGAITHSYSAAGAFNWFVKVTDGAGAQAATNGQVVVTNPVLPPVVTLIKKADSTPFTLIITGNNLKTGIAVYINGTLWTNVTWKSSAKLKIGKGNVLKAAVPKGQTTHFSFVNPDGGQTTYDFTY